MCSACGRESLRWEGRCPACGEWNAMEEVAGPRATRRERARGPAARPSRLAESGREAPSRRPTNLGELDLVLGGGLVPGSVVLLGGPPGVGKSTLLLQLAARVAQQGARALYVSGEESAEQVWSRAARLGGAAGETFFLAETGVERIIAAAAELQPDLLCVDSVQTLQLAQLDSGPGTVAQVRGGAGALQAFAKDSGIPTFLIGHVTKGGGLAGPSTLAHLVDVVVRFDGTRSGEHRILRAIKNRFGSVGEVAVFRMTEAGLEPVGDAGTAFLANRRPGACGSAVSAPMEGSRPLLAEIQALTISSRYPTPQRRTTGFPIRRLSMLLAVLERRAGIGMGTSDVFVNVAGGLRLLDPAADLAVLAALISAELDRPLREAAFVGEVGLGGEVREVLGLERRLREIRRGGLRSAVLPSASQAPSGLAVQVVERVSDLVDLVREGHGEMNAAAARA
ncbi:MAG: DNA repair protein RadA [Gemmatimonadota bacterium]